MAHYAQINDSNIVTQVLVMDNDMEENEGEQACVDWLVKNVGGTWVKTSYNHKIRKQYAGIGMTYNAAKDIFISPQPYPSWSLDENSDWQPPTPRPDDDQPYLWDEENQVWVETE